MAAVDALQHLCGTLLPHARERLHELEAKLATADREATASLIDEALSGFLAMIDAYLDVLVPARSRVDPADGFDRDDPLCLRNRDRYVDVLPAAWDLASPTLAELGVAGTVEVDAPALADVTLNRDAAHVLLAEWDDHLFALGLAPVRAVYRRAARLLGLNDDVFLLRGPEVVAMLREPATTVDLERRRATWARRARLRPPNRIQAGKPVAGDIGDRRLGVGIGPPFRGRATRRASLQAVLERPPPPGSVVILPALTAQAALVLKQLAISAVCTEHGGALSHGSLMARELGLSALIGCRACSSIPDGAEVYLDPIAGRITICG
jgi:phosphohistidine swiveling domain-containing protein